MEGCGYFIIAIIVIWLISILWSNGVIQALFWVAVVAGVLYWIYHMWASAAERNTKIRITEEETRRIETARKKADEDAKKADEDAKQRLSIEILEDLDRRLSVINDHLNTLKGEKDESEIIANFANILAQIRDISKDYASGKTHNALLNHKIISHAKSISDHLVDEGYVDHQANKELKRIFNNFSTAHEDLSR